MTDLVESGKAKIDWISRFTPVMNQLEEEFKKNQPFKGVKIAGCLHLEMKTARFAMLLKAGGARVALCPSNPLSTQDDVVAALNDYGIETFAKRGFSRDEYYKALNKVLDMEPNILIDDGADMTAVVHGKRTDLLKDIWGINEETTTGVNRLRALEEAGQLKVPVVAVNDSLCKFLFDNRYGTGQSVWDGIMRTTNLVIAGKNVVVSGYGWCGKGISMRAEGLGASVIVVEPDPVRALEARMDGHRVMPMKKAAGLGDIFVTATGNRDCITKDDFAVMKDGAVLANAGHFDVEINKNDLESMSKSRKELKPNITQYVLGNGNRIYLLAEGRLVNLAAGDGHPAEIMDMSFAVQALAARYLVENKGRLPAKVLTLPRSLDKKVASIKLMSMGIETEQLTSEQKKYMESWDVGT